MCLCIKEGTTGTMFCYQIDGPKTDGAYMQGAYTRGAYTQGAYNRD